MWMFVCALCMVFAVVVSPVHAGDGYLFVTFRGERTPMTEQIYFAVSEDGLKWEALHDGKPVLVSAIGEKGVRDPFLIRSPDGKSFFLIATDLSVNLIRHDWGRASQRGSKSIVVWESTDLVNWSEPRLAKVSPDDAGCTWAPQAIFDDATGDYMVYWSSTTARDGFRKFRIWAARTKDFKNFGEPFVHLERDVTVIDADIVRDGDRFHRFTKDERHKTIFMDTATSLNGPWTPVDGFTLAKLDGFEGPQCFKLKPAAPDAPPTWCLLIDHFAKGEGYKAFVTTDLANGKFERAADAQFPFRFRHGSVLAISAAEMDALKKRYPTTAPVAR